MHELRRYQYLISFPASFCEAIEWVPLFHLHVNFLIKPVVIVMAKIKDIQLEVNGMLDTFRINCSSKGFSRVSCRIGCLVFWACRRS